MPVRLRLVRLLLLLVITAVVYLFIEGYRGQAPQPVPMDSTELTLEQAVVVAEKEFKRQKATTPIILNTGSSDGPDCGSTEDAGRNGKRACWSVIITEVSKAANAPTPLYVVELVGLKATISTIGDITDEFPVEKERLVSTKRLVEKAIQLGLRSGAGWAWGYHFGYQRLPGERSTQTVVGRDAEGNRAAMIFDALTGELITASRKVPDSDGRAVWRPWELNEGR